MNLHSFLISAFVFFHNVSARNVYLSKETNLPSKKSEIESRTNDDNEGEIITERFSNINFNSHVESTWGRLYIERLPGHNGIQFFRGHFGALTPPLHSVKFVVADPLTYCNGKTEKSSQDLFGSDSVVVVKRGECSFVAKSKRVQESGASGILLINNEVRRYKANYIL